jgi:acyl carrier protein
MTDVDEDFARTARVVRDTFQVKPEVSITPSTTSADVDGWDSLSHSILIMRVEEEFGIELPFDRIFDLENVGALVELITTTRGLSA